MVQKATIDDIPEILALQRASFVPIAEILKNPDIQPMTQTMEELSKEFENGLILKYVHDEKIVGSVRGRIDEEHIYHVGKLIVHPDFQNKGIGRSLILEIEKFFPTCTKFSLFIGAISPNTFHLYSGLGYKKIKRTSKDDVCMIVMEKTERP